VKGINKTGNSASTTAAQLAAFKTAMRLPRSGQFYLLKKSLTGTIVKRAFTSIASVLDAQTKTFINAQGGAGLSFNSVEISEVRGSVAAKHIGGVTVNTKLSLVAKSFLRPPLLAPGAGLFEVRFAHILLLEMTVAPVAPGDSDSYLFVYREMTDDPLDHGLGSSCDEIMSSAFIEQFVKPASSGPVTDVTRIERISMRMMASSRGEIRRKVVDAYDVGAATSSLGLHRTIAGSMTLAVPQGNVRRMVSVSPHRQRVRTGTSRTSLDDVIYWACECAVGFSKSSSVRQTSSAFLAQFAQPVVRLLDKTPSSVLIERQALSEAINEHMATTGQVWLRDKTTPATWTSLDNVLDAITETIALNNSPLDSDGKAITLNPSLSEAFYAAVTPVQGLGKTDVLSVRISSRVCKIELPRAVGSLGDGLANSTRIHLDEFVNRCKAFRVVLDAGRVLFCSEGAYGSSNLALATTQLASIFFGVTALGNVHTEKGKTTRASKSFDSTSSFHAIESDPQLSHADSLLICDDSTVEWADYIELDAHSPRIRWFHAKVQQIELAADKAARLAGAGPGYKITQPVSTQPSLSASDLEEVVGQAIKNLARLRISTKDGEFPVRHRTWVSGKCSLPTKNSITRLRRLGTLNISDIKNRFDATAADPLAVYEVAIVVPNYSKTKLEAELKKIPSGQASPFVLQAFWLLSGFMHACLEVGARPLVFMHK